MEKKIHKYLPTLVDEKSQWKYIAWFCMSFIETNRNKKEWDLRMYKILSLEPISGEKLHNQWDLEHFRSIFKVVFQNRFRLSNYFGPKTEKFRWRANMMKTELWWVLCIQKRWLAFVENFFDVRAQPEWQRFQFLMSQEFPHSNL